MIKEKFEELKKEKIFQDIKHKGKLGRLFLVFALCDVDLNLEQIDFSFIKNNTITCFSFKHGKWKKTETKKKMDINCNQIDLNIKGVRELYKKNNKLLKNKNLSANKFILALQRQKNRVVFNVTTLCDNFHVLKATFDAKTLTLIDTKLYNLLNFLKIKK